jgi:hypothetical protein
VSEFENLDYYTLLGVSRSASLDEIKRAYRREISKFHPDRFVNGTPEEKVYASERSQRLTEAYRVLSDFAERSAYNRSQPTTVPGMRTPHPAPTTPAQPRDHQAELYEQAQRHLADDRLLQGIGVLRQLQQINPFYRDTAEQLAAAEARLNQHKAPAAKRRSRPLLVAGGVVGGLIVAVLAAWAIGLAVIAAVGASAVADGAAVGSGGCVGGLVAMTATGALVLVGVRLAVAPRMPIAQAASPASTSPPNTPPVTSSGRGRRLAACTLG